MNHHRFQSFKDFYPYYLREHMHPVCRFLHFTGTLGVISITAASFITSSSIWVYSPVLGYSFAWVGHFAFEKNRPATFKYPFFSFCGDWVMLKDIITGKIKI